MQIIGKKIAIMNEIATHQLRIARAYDGIQLSQEAAGRVFSPGGRPRLEIPEYHSMYISLYTVWLTDMADISMLKARSLYFLFPVQIPVLEEEYGDFHRDRLKMR